MSPQASTPHDTTWIQRVADAVHAYARGRKRPDETIVCASGISPSGMIHLGNLREVMTVHLVVEELQSRGLPAEHLHSWDDFDRFRKVPAGFPETLAEFVGRPLIRVPDPSGRHPSYADRFIAEFTESLERIGVRPRAIRQSAAYRRGDYTSAIRLTLDRRLEIFDILAAFQTPGRQSEDMGSRRDAYYPFRPYCATCDRDAAVVTGYDRSTDVLSYDCGACHSHHDVVLGATPLEGKLVWKIDWPMRWARERVDFEPAGEDHSSPQGSRAVGIRVVHDVFGGVAPFYVGYAFVGLAGAASKMSSSGGIAPTPAT
ncbi:MAG TPA: lysine--tRNA ligase, partial [Gemmatimonadaceae bacterium]|nr:lysine--tRNA ligase [Gemmatimonadaceae bacterium]